MARCETAQPHLGACGVFVLQFEQAMVVVRLHHAVRRIRPVPPLPPHLAVVVDSRRRRVDVLAEHAAPVLSGADEQLQSLLRRYSGEVSALPEPNIGPLVAVSLPAVLR